MKQARRTDASKRLKGFSQVSCALQAVLGLQGAWMLLVALALWGVSVRVAAEVPPTTSTAFCRTVSSKLPNLPNSLCQQARLADSGARSVRGQVLWQRDVLGSSAPPDAIALPGTVATSAASSAAAPKLNVLVIGGIHGDELSSTSLAFHWINRAAETPLDVRWRFVPALNPDGLLAPKPSRVNANGVDLNRNFATPNWAREAPRYWEVKTRKDKRRYPGPKALSEPESRFIADEMARFKPNLIVAIHAPYGVLDFDGPSVPPSKLGRLYLDQVGIFPGSLGNYGGVHKGVPVVTVELPSAIRTPTEAEMRQMWLDLVRWMDDRLLTPSRAAQGR